jgi:hypothetical protein
MKILEEIIKPTINYFIWIKVNSVLFLQRMVKKIQNFLELKYCGIIFIKINKIIFLIFLLKYFFFFIYFFFFSYKGLFLT